MPLIKQIFPADNSNISLWKIEEPVDVLENLYLSFGQNLEEIPLHENKRKQFFAARILIYSLLKNARLMKDASGCPLLEGHPGYISITHDRDFAAVYFNKNHPVGIDLERFNPKAWQLKDRFIHPDEEFIFEELKDDPIKIATLVWCVKEAVYKRLQKKAIHFKDHLQISKIHPERSVVEVSVNTPVNVSTINLKYELLQDDHWWVYTI
ncbi:MAG: hypothetical protein KatS3mg034_0282 [Vicingaceae bacterium]|nr:MAG: hypothetical protein KatS3mg034_0282 [Vicingaceae bacterium]